jgi:hypothetical protein
VAISWVNELVVAQTPDGTWARREVKVAQRFRIRVISDRAGVKSNSHQFGHGEEFELLVDTHLDVWVRPFGSAAPFAKDFDAHGVSMLVVDNITAGVLHEVRIQQKPADENVARWTCSCGASSRAPVTPEAARAEADAHLEAFGSGGAGGAGGAVSTAPGAVER